MNCCLNCVNENETADSLCLSFFLCVSFKRLSPAHQTTKNSVSRHKPVGTCNSLFTGSRGRQLSKCSCCSFCWLHENAHLHLLVLWSLAGMHGIQLGIAARSIHVMRVEWPSMRRSEKRQSWKQTDTDSDRQSSTRRTSKMQIEE